MTELLNHVIDAHGGLENWRRSYAISASAQISGILFDLRGQSDIFKGVEVEIDCAKPRTVYRSLGGVVEKSGYFEPDRVAIYRGDDLESELRNPRAVVQALSPEDPWHELHALYFGGYAIWHYLAAPFVFSQPGFQVEELPTWTEGGEVWRRLQVTFPESVPSNCQTQVYYFDERGLQRRMDYHVEILNLGIPVAHYSDDHREVDGLQIPHRRRAVPKNEDGTSDPNVLYVGIDLDDVTVRRTQTKDL